MNNTSNISGNKSFNLEILNENIKKIKDLLLDQRIYRNVCFKTWDKDFKTIYNKKHINLRLYIIYALLYLIGHIFISKLIKNKNKSDLKEFNLLEIVKENQIKNKSIVNSLKLS